MKITSQNKAFYDAVFSLVMVIPKGKVTTYGHIAELVGKPGNARQVGSALKHCCLLINQLNEAFAGDIGYSYDSLPWQRVVASGGKISPRVSGGQVEQARRLREEGIEVSDFKVDLDLFGWLPDDVTW